MRIFHHNIFLQAIHLNIQDKYWPIVTNLALQTACTWGMAGAQWFLDLSIVTSYTCVQLQMWPSMNIWWEMYVKLFCLFYCIKSSLFLFFCCHAKDKYFFSTLQFPCQDFPAAFIWTSCLSKSHILFPPSKDLTQFTCHKMENVLIPYCCLPRVA